MSTVRHCDWYAFCQALYRGIEGEDWREMSEAYKEMNEQRCGSEEATGGPEAKALWKMKAAKEAGEEYYDPTRVDIILGRNKTRLALWEEHIKDPTVALDKAFRCLENWYQRSRPECFGEGAFSNGCCWFPPKCGTNRCGRASGPTWIRWTVCVCAQRPWNGMRQESMGHMASSFSSS